MELSVEGCKIIGDMETPQHGNGSKMIFEEFSFFRNSRKFLQKFRIVEGFPNILYPFPNI